MVFCLHEKTLVFQEMAECVIAYSRMGNIVLPSVPASPFV